MRLEFIILDITISISIIVLARSSSFFVCVASRPPKLSFCGKGHRFCINHPHVPSVFFVCTSACGPSCRKTTRLQLATFTFHALCHPLPGDCQLIARTFVPLETLSTLLNPRGQELRLRKEKLLYVPVLAF